VEEGATYDHTILNQPEEQATPGPPQTRKIAGGRLHPARASAKESQIGYLSVHGCSSSMGGVRIKLRHSVRGREV